MSVGIFLIFRAFSHYNVVTIQAIVVNYFVCVITGIVFLGGAEFAAHFSFDLPWVWIAVTLGAIFIGTFYLMAMTTQRLGITVASVASKMSLVIPVLVSLFILQIASRPIIGLNYLGITLAIAAIILSSIKKKKENKEQIKWSAFLMPILVFIFGGVIDTSINFVSHQYLTASTEAIFPIVIFATAFSIGAVLLMIKGKQLQLKSIIGGTVLGIINYFSIYFLVKSLGAFGNDGAIVYPVVNVGIILISALSSVAIFREKLSKINKIGLAVAILAVFLIFYQEIMAQL